jgi:hypothetical protein
VSETRLLLRCVVKYFKLDVRGSVHHSTIHTEKSNKLQQCVKMYYSVFIWSSTCFGRHTAHHQDHRTALAASGFAYVEGCWMCSCWMLSGRAWQPGCWCSFMVLMMGGVSPETCWASYKYGIINFDTLLHLVGFFCMNRTVSCLYRTAPDDEQLLVGNMSRIN